MIKLVVFLGNYGDEYTRTRHNVAWQFCTSLGFDSLPWGQKFAGEYASYQVSGRKVHLLKPLTYMNRSGESAIQAAQFFKIAVEEVLIIHDELELPFGTVSFKNGGGLAAHNGLRSIKDAFGSADFLRLRFGLTKPADKNIADYVLSAFSSEEASHLPAIFDFARSVFESALSCDDAASLAKEYAKCKVY